MNPRYEQLLEEVCIRLGFCGGLVDGEPLHPNMFIADRGPVNADSFADAVFAAEDWEPKDAAALQHRQSIIDAFVRHMGSSVVDAQLLK